MRIRHTFKYTLIPIVILVFGLAVTGQLSNNDGDTMHSSIGKNKMEIALACDAGMTNILQALEGLRQQYIQFSGIGSMSITKIGSPDSGNCWLVYKKNASDVRFPSSGQDVAKVDGLVIGDGGAALSIAILNAEDPSGVNATRHNGGGYYKLLSAGKRPIIELIYSLQLNSTDPALEKSVKDIIERQADNIKNLFRDIIGTDPAKERSRACSEVMTNVQQELQGLAHNFPVLSGIGSAAIENMGTTNSFSYYLKYSEKAQIEPPLNDTNQLITDKGGDVIGKGGVALEIYIQNADEPPKFKDGGTGYSLECASGNEKIWMVYALNSEDRNLREAVRKIFESQYQKLGKALDGIIDFN